MTTIETDKPINIRRIAGQEGLGGAFEQQSDGITIITTDMPEVTDPWTTGRT